MPTQIAFVNGKGGVGKTTATTLIAAAFRSANISVSIDDRDPQLSATTAAGIFDIPLGDSADTVLIDTAPAIQMPSTLDAIQTADLVVLVTSPSPLDLATTAATAKWIQAQRTSGETRLLFNLVQTNNRFFDEMADIAREIPFPALKNHLVRRTAYQVAQIAGWKSIPAAYREEIIKVTMEIAQALPKPQTQSSTPCL
ncbi:MAG TPA: ParA family protein [Phycisphaerae bacterium]|nr:ParA family protein [Phycisphaerae bacterium]